MSQRKPPSQECTALQLAKLKILVMAQEHDLSDGCVGERSARDFIFIANYHGLYDAADLVRTRMERGQFDQILDWSPIPQDWKKVWENFNHEGQPWYGLAMLSLNTGNIEKAKEYFEKFEGVWERATARRN